MRHHRLHPTLLLSVFLATVAVAPADLNAASLTWTSPLGGNAGTAGNWSPAQVPQSLDDLSFALAAVFGVAFDASADTSSALRVKAGTVTANVTGQHVVTGNLEVALASADSAALTINAGTLRVKQGAFVGIGHQGSLIVQGETSRLAGEGTFLSASAAGSFARVRVLGGARLEANTSLTLGLGSNMLVGGSGSSTLAPATITTNGALAVQGGLFEVARGALVHAGGRLTLANGFLDGTTTLHVDSLARVEVLDDFRILHDTAFGPVSDVATIEHGARVVVGDSTVLGSGNTFTALNGVLQLRSGGTLDTRSFVRNTQGSLQLAGGTMIIRGGIYDEPTKTLLIAGSGVDTSRVELRDGATMLLNAATAGANALELREGALRVTTGAHVNVTQGFVTLNQFGAGELDVDSLGVFTSTGGFNIQDGSVFDPMRVQVTNGGVLTCAGMTVKSANYATPGQARIVVDGAGSALHSGNCSLNNNLFGTDAPLEVTVDHSGLLDGTQFGASTLTLGLRNSVFVGAGAKLGRFGQIAARCRITLAGGTLEAGNFMIFDPDTATVRGFGAVASPVFQGSSLARIEAAGGTLTMGADTDTAGVFVRGTTDVGSATLSLLDADAAMAGHLVTLGGGTLATSHGLRVIAGDSLTGHGTVNGAVLNEGMIAPQGGGLSFSGAVSGPGSYTGDKLTFLTGSSFTTAGVIDADVASSSGSVITATGDISLGRAAGTGVNLAGDLNVGPYTLTPHGTCVLGSTRLSGGAILATTPISSNGVLYGRGTIQVSTNLIQFGSVISPGDSVGRLAVTGNVQLRNSGTLFVQLGNHAAGSWDTLVVSNQFTALTGSTLRVRFAPGFTFGTADTFVVVSANLRAGSFNIIDAPPVPAGWTLKVLYGTKTVSIVVALDPLLVGVSPAALPARFSLTSLRRGAAADALALALPQAADVQLVLFDVAGRRVATLASGALGAGTHTLPIPAEGVPDGLYFARALLTVEGRRTSLETRVLRVH